MTRINCVPVTELTGRHLVAEYRELPRVFTLVRRAVDRGERPDDRRNPDRYVLGTGHCRFFYPRLLWLSRRHMHLTAEMGDRGYKTNWSVPLTWSDRDIPREWWGDWAPSEDDVALNRRRIRQRLAEAAARKEAA